MDLTLLARRHRVPGAQVAIHQAGETITAETGELAHGSGRRVTRDTAFPIGSITKSFTATTAMILVADGDLELDRPVGGYLPDLAPSHEASRNGTQPAFSAGRVTLRQLLSHTSGFASGPSPEEVSTTSARRYLTEHCGPVLPPGAGFSYSNVGYVLVGRLIEAVTGMSWREAVESILLRPLGVPDGPRPVATGHSANPQTGQVRAVHQALAAVEAPAGGLAVSALDLVALGTLHMGQKVLSPRYAEQMRRAVPGADPCGLADGWGLGLAVFDNCVGHDGNGFGTSCYLRVAPERGCVVAFTSNSNSGSAMWQDLLGELKLPMRQSREWDREPVIPAPSDCAGRYVNGLVDYMVEVRDGTAYLAIDGATPARLICHPDLLFSTRDPTSGRRVLGGRFLPDAIVVGGRLACRRSAALRSAA